MKDNIAKIISLGFGMKGIAKKDGKVCFIEGVLPGEEVSFKIVKEKKKYIEGELVKILKESPDRVEAECPYFKNCGGCGLQHMTYSTEIENKEQQVKDILSRIGKQNSYKYEGIEKCSKCYGYRSSITLHKKDKKLGFYSKKTNNIVEIEKCLVADEALNIYLAKIDTSAVKKDVTLKSDANGKVHSSVKSGDRFYVDIFGEEQMFLSPKSFSQVNREIAVKISKVLEEWIGDAGKSSTFFDLYCGNGFFSFLIKNDFTKKIGIDSNRVAINSAKETKNKYKENEDIRFYLDDASEVFGDLFYANKIDKNVVFLDPPRSGLDSNFVEEICSTDGIDSIYYLSCDPGSLARDIEKISSNSKFRLNRVKIFDMFPRTPHIETLAELIKE